MLISDVLKALPTLTPQELQQVRACVDLLCPTQTGDTRFDLVWSAVTNTLDSVCPPINVVKRNARYKTFHENCLVLHRLAEQTFECRSRAELLRCLLFLCSLCVRHVQRQEIPLNVWTLGSAFSICGVVVENNFPGYIKAGLAPAILRGLDATQ